MFAAYIMQTFEMDWGTIVAGLRVEDTEYETNGFKLATISDENLSFGNVDAGELKKYYQLREVILTICQIFILTMMWPMIKNFVFHTQQG